MHWKTAGICGIKNFVDQTIQEVPLFLDKEQEYKADKKIIEYARLANHYATKMMSMILKYNLLVMRLGSELIYKYGKNLQPENTLCLLVFSETVLSFSGK